MTSMQEESTTSIVKSDRLGRTHYSADYKDQVLDAFATSSLSGPIFAKQCGIKYPTFASWVAKQKREATTGERGDGLPASRPSWLPRSLKIPPPIRSWSTFPAAQSRES